MIIFNFHFYSNELALDRCVVLYYEISITCECTRIVCLPILVYLLLKLKTLQIKFAFSAHIRILFSDSITNHLANLFDKLFGLYSF